MPMPTCISLALLVLVACYGSTPQSHAEIVDVEQPTDADDLPIWHPGCDLIRIAGLEDDDELSYLMGVCLARAAVYLVRG